MTTMRRSLGAGIFAATVLAAVSVWPVTTNARDAAVTGAVASTAAARAELATPKVKRVRKQSLRRDAALATPASRHPQCFLFWCNTGGTGGRAYSFLMLGVAY